MKLDEISKTKNYEVQPVVEISKKNYEPKQLSVFEYSPAIRLSETKYVVFTLEYDPGVFQIGEDVTLN